MFPGFWTFLTQLTLHADNPPPFTLNVSVCSHRQVSVHTDDLSPYMLCVSVYIQTGSLARPTGGFQSADIRPLTADVTGEPDHSLTRTTRAGKRASQAHKASAAERREAQPTKSVRLLRVDGQVRLWQRVWMEWAICVRYQGRPGFQSCHCHTIAVPSPFHADTWQLSQSVI